MAAGPAPKPSGTIGNRSQKCYTETAAGRVSSLLSGDQACRNECANPEPAPNGDQGFESKSPGGGALQFWKSLMLMDAAILVGLGFAAGYGLRAWISTRRRRAIRKARGD